MCLARHLRALRGEGGSAGAAWLGSLAPRTACHCAVRAVRRPRAPAARAQALVKARGDGLGFDLGKAEFCFEGRDRSRARVLIEGRVQPRRAAR